MRLICMAHRGEAQVFLKNLALKQIEDSFYAKDDLGLLITGEGLFKAMTILPYIIGKYSITEIINCGIAGALDNTVELDCIYPVRTCYGFTSTILFHSYSSNPPPKTKNINWDCISFEQRVLDNKTAQELSYHASIVDRELFGIAKISQKFKIPFSAFKLISDIAGEQTNCFDLKEKAKMFSDSLWNYYISNYQPTTPKTSQNEEQKELNFPFKASFTQKKQIQKLFNLINKLSKKNSLHRPIENFKSANDYIDYLEDIVNPINAKIKKILNSEFTPFNEIGAQIILDPQLDKKKFTLKMEINSAENLVKLNKAINKFNFQKIENLWEGKSDVQ